MGRLVTPPRMPTRMEELLCWLLSAPPELSEPLAQDVLDVIAAEKAATE